MNDRPTAAELIAATRLYLERDLIPSLSDQRLRFQTLIAVNVLAIAEREMQLQEQQLSEEWQWLAPLLGLEGSAPEQATALRQRIVDANIQLCERIRAGQFDSPRNFQALLHELQKSVKRKLAIANPRYLGG